jgi:hypothetical protein
VDFLQANWLWLLLVAVNPTARVSADRMIRTRRYLIISTCPGGLAARRAGGEKPAT